MEQLDVRRCGDGTGVAALAWSAIDAAVRRAAADSISAAVGYPVEIVRLRLVDATGRDVDGGGTLVVGYVPRG